MTSDPPCIAALKAQAERDPEGVASAIGKLTVIKPLIRCHRDDDSTHQITRHLASILARIFPEVHLDISDADLARLVREDIKSAHAAATIGTDLDARPRVSIGEAASDAYFVDAAGWRLRVASPGQEQVPLARNGANAASALLAAALVAARVLNEGSGLVAARTAPGPTRINLWHPIDAVDGPPIPAILDLDIHCFGHGSISNAAWGALEKWPALRGRAVVVDPDVYQGHNPARYGFLPHDEIGTRKVEELRARLAQHELHVEAKPERVQDWRKANDERPQLALICPDNRTARAWATDTHPILAVSASASDRQAQVSLCNPEWGLCAYCLQAPSHATQTSHRDAIVAFTGLSLQDVIRFTNEWNGKTSEPLDERSVRTMETTRKKSPGDFQHWIGKHLLDFLDVHRKELYSSATIKSDAADRIHMPLPIASVAAGAIALAGVLRMTITGFKKSSCDFNHLLLDVWTGELRFVQETRPSSLTCLCQHPARRTWASQPA